MKQRMSRKHWIVAALSLGLGLAGLSTGTQAALVSQTVNGVKLVYDDVADLTWVADANLFYTQYQANNGIVADIIADIGSIASGDGTHILSDSDFIPSDGRMTWYGAMAWTSWLDYGGVSDWRLPTVSPIDGVSFDNSYSYDGTTDVGYNISAPGTTYAGSNASELAHLFYNGLDGVGYFDASGTFVGDGNYGLVNGTGPFVNVQSYVYWSGTAEYAPDQDGAWHFVTRNGNQFNGSTGHQVYGWAVRSGQVDADAPLPATVWLVALGLMLLGPVGVGRRRLW